MLTAAMVAVIAGTLILFGIVFDTSASTPHSKALAWAIHVTMIHSVKRRAIREDTTQPATQPSMLSGAAEYERHCIACHGGPGVARAPWASAMLPTPPFLIDAPRRWSHAELYRLVHDGVKMTGMPAWGEIEPDRKIADIVNFLELMPKLPPEQFARLRQRACDRPPISLPTKH